MKKILKSLIFSYQKFLSPLLKILGNGRCRFIPTCSQYSLLAIEKHGVRKGLLLFFKRFLRCRPYGGMGFDYP